MAPPRTALLVSHETTDTSRTNVTRPAGWSSTGTPTYGCCSDVSTPTGSVRTIQALTTRAPADREVNQEAGARVRRSGAESG